MNYRLIKEYPNLRLKVGDIVEWDTTLSTHQYICKDKCLGISGIDPSKYPEFWAKIKQPLFTTEDGVEIFEGDLYYFVNCHYDIINKNATIYCGKGGSLEKNLLFSTKEKAEEYIIMNKPCLSLKDVQEILSSKKWAGVIPIISEEMTILVKSKIINK